jgi:hypothetical protein
LLDWLADEFMSGGWTLKRIHRLIMTSTVYRQSSRRAAAIEAVDPENRLLGRMPVRRLEAEEVRDAILAVSGRLYHRMYGPPVPVAPDETGQVIVGQDNRDTAGRPVSERVSIGAEEFRRSLYIQVRRSMPLGLLDAFDAPAMTPNCERRKTSTVAPQALLMMNSAFVVAESEAFAARVEEEAGDDPSAQVRLAWRLALGVEPDAGEVASAVSFLAEQREDFAAAMATAKEDQGAKKPKEPASPPDRRALASFCQALLSSNAFLYVD